MADQKLDDRVARLVQEIGWYSKLNPTPSDGRATYTGPQASLWEYILAIEEYLGIEIKKVPSKTVAVKTGEPKAS